MPGGRDAEVIVVGGGPAGSTLAAALAGTRHAVLLLDKARFPRHKPCSDYVNPAGADILAEMGMLPQRSPAEPPRNFSNIHVVYAERGGGLRLAVQLGDEVSAGDEIGEIADVFGTPKEKLCAGVDGFVMRLMRFGAVASGAEVAWIAN